QSDHDTRHLHSFPTRRSSDLSTKVEYEFPGTSAFALKATNDIVNLPKRGGTISVRVNGAPDGDVSSGRGAIVYDRTATDAHFIRSEEHTSELQSRSDIVCRLL